MYTAYKKDKFNLVQFISQNEGIKNTCRIQDYNSHVNYPLPLLLLEMQSPFLKH